MKTYVNLGKLCAMTKYNKDVNKSYLKCGTVFVIFFFIYFLFFFLCIYFLIVGSHIFFCFVCLYSYILR